MMTVRTAKKYKMQNYNQRLGRGEKGETDRGGLNTNHLMDCFASVQK